MRALLCHGYLLLTCCLHLQGSERINLVGTILQHPPPVVFHRTERGTTTDDCWDTVLDPLQFNIFPFGQMAVPHDYSLHVGEVLGVWWT